MPFPKPDGRWQVSTEGGAGPRWRRDGKELFYVSPTNKLMAVKVLDSGASLSIGRSRALFQTDPPASLWAGWRFDVTADARPLPGDTVSFAWGINENGQAVGNSGLCSNTSVPPGSAGSVGPHGVLWDADGTPHALASPAGSAGILVLPTAINNAGEVTGNSVMSDGTVHAFLWASAVAEPQDLGTSPAGSPLTVVTCCGTINDNGQIVGFSVDMDGNFRALLWQNGAPMDLNALIPADSPWYLLQALSINNTGEIAALGFNLDTFEVHAVLLSPINGVGPAARGSIKPPALPANVKGMIRAKERH